MKRIDYTHLPQAPFDIRSEAAAVSFAELCGRHTEYLYVNRIWNAPFPNEPSHELKWTEMPDGDRARFWFKESIWWLIGIAFIFAMVFSSLAYVASLFGWGAFLIPPTAMPPLFLIACAAVLFGIGARLYVHVPRAGCVDAYVAHNGSVELRHRRAFPKRMRLDSPGVVLACAVRPDHPREADSPAAVMFLSENQRPVLILATAPGPEQLIDAARRLPKPLRDKANFSLATVAVHFWRD